MLPRLRNHAHVSLFAERVADSVSELLLNVIVLGLTVILIQYAQLAINDTADLVNAEFWKRVVLLGMVMFFAAYNALAYRIYMDGFVNNEVNRSKGRFQPYEGEQTPEASAGRVTVLFLLDLTQVGLSASLFAGLAIGEPLELLSEGRRALSERLPLQLEAILFLYSVMLAWHLVVLLWYYVWAWHLNETFVPYRHLWFTLFYLLGTVFLAVFRSVAMTHYDGIVKQLIDWPAIGLYGVSVLAMYRLMLLPAFREIHREQPPKDVPS